MNTPNGSAKKGAVFLNPGDFRFYYPLPGRPALTRLHTLLGSCVSVIVWHPERGIGGMNHIILPERSVRLATEVADGRYCASAVAMLSREIARVGTSPWQYQTYLVGGGKMYAVLAADEERNIGSRNVSTARAALQAAGFLIRNEHVGLEGYRKVELDLHSGAVSVLFNNKRIPL